MPTNRSNRRAPRPRSRSRSRSRNREGSRTRFATGSTGIVVVPRGVNNPRTVHVNKWGLTTNLVTSTNAAEGKYAINFQLSDTNDYASLALVFDSYRIVRIRFMIEPNTQLSGPLPAGLTGAPCIAAVDKDDGAAPASFSSMCDYQNAAYVQAGRSILLDFVPRIAMAVQVAGAFTGSANQERQWIDTSSPSVQHYGVKIAVGLQSSLTLYHSWQAFVCYTFELQYMR